MSGIGRRQARRRQLSSDASAPGDIDMRIECLPGSRLPDALRVAGYDLEPEGEGERSLPTAIRQQFTLTSSGALEGMTEGSMKPVTTVVTLAGIVKVERYQLRAGAGPMIG